MVSGTLAEGAVHPSSGETLVISATKEGFRVHAPAEPSRQYVVSGLPDAPTCTCAASRAESANSASACDHIRAVAERFFPTIGIKGDVPNDPNGHHAAATVGEPRRRRSEVPEVAQMLLRRCLSTDGRSDTLSVEFSLPVSDLSAAHVAERAQGLLALQSIILRQFAGEQSQVTSSRPEATRDKSTTTASNEAVPARLLGISGMKGKFGRRLFIVVDVDGDTARLFGNRRQLGEALAAAGYAHLIGAIAEGMSIDLPCRVMTKLSDDGKYINIEQVLPPETSDASGTPGSAP